MSHKRLFQDLAEWRELGWLRMLDEQFARFLGQLAPEGGEDVLLAAVLASHQLGRGHVCLPLARCLDNPREFLALPPEDRDGQNRIDPELQRRENDARNRLQQRLDDLELSRLDQALKQSALVTTGPGTTPLVFDRGNLYLRRTWKAESDIAAAIAERHHGPQPPPGPDEVGTLIREIFGQGGGLLPRQTGRPDWQQVACALAARGRFTIITGGPGTGKTWTVVRIIAVLQKMHLAQASTPLRIRLAAPTGKAAQRLSESIADGWKDLVDTIGEVGMVEPEPASTLHRLLGSQRHTRHFRHDHTNPLSADVVIVDEASMIDQELMQNLLEALAPTTRLILLGDKDQLSSVEAGAVFGDLCRDADRADYSAALCDWLEEALGVRPETTGTGDLADQRVMLRINHRSTEDINRLAECVNAGHSGRAAELLSDDAGDELHWPSIESHDDEAMKRLMLHGASDGSDRHGYLACLDFIHSGRQALGESPNPASVDDWARGCLQAQGRFQVLTALKRGPWGVAGINSTVRTWLAGLRRQGRALIDDGEWFDGRPVLITRNDYGTGLMNGDIGLCLAVPIQGERQLRVVFQKEKGELHYFSPSRIRDCQTAWAMTVHKSQGSEFTHTVLVLPDQYNRVLTRELVYTGLTRARDRFTLVAANAEVLTKAIEHRTERSSALAERLAEQDQKPHSKTEIEDTRKEQESSC